MLDVPPSIPPGPPAPPDPTPAPRALAALAPLSRRDVLAGLAALLAGTSVGCTDRGPTTTPGAGTPAALALGEGPYRTLHALADAVLPGPPRVPWDAGSLAIAERIAVLLAAGGDELLEPARAGLQLLEHAPLGTELSMSRFSHASRAKRLAILRAWADSSVPVKRLVVASLRRAVVFCAWASPETWALVGYDGPLLPPGVAAPGVCPLGMGAGRAREAAVAPTAGVTPAADGDAEGGDATGSPPPPEPLTWEALLR